MNWLEEYSEMIRRGCKCTFKFVQKKVPPPPQEEGEPAEFVEASSGRVRTFSEHSPSHGFYSNTP